MIKHLTNIDKFLFEKGYNSIKKTYNEKKKFITIITTKNINENTQENNHKKIQKTSKLMANFSPKGIFLNQKYTLGQNKTLKTSHLKGGVYLTIGGPKIKYTPPEGGEVFNLSNKEIDSKIFNNFMSNMINKKDNDLFTYNNPLILSFDTEFVYLKDNRYPVSYQFSFRYSNTYYNFIFISIENNCYFNRKCNFTDFLSYILHYIYNELKIDIKANPYKKYLKYIDFFKRKKLGLIDKDEKEPHLDYTNIILLMHFGRADLSMFNDTCNSLNIMKFTNEIQRGIVTLDKNIYFNIRINNNAMSRIKLSVRDTMSHAVGERSLQALGKIANLEKKEIDDKKVYERMDKYLFDNTADFIDYAMHDTIVPLEYLNKLYGIENNNIAPTLTSLSAKYYKNSYKNLLIKDNIKAKNEADFLYHYSGLVKVERGLEKEDNNFYIKKSLEPLSSNLKHCYLAHTESYHGGLNACYTHGFVTETTYDLDLSSAYIVAMSVIPKIDFSKDVIIKTNYKLTLDMIRNFITDDYIKPFVAYVNFKFPQGAIPCIPQYSKHGLIYTYEGKDVACNIAELFIALQQGCEIYVLSSYEVNVDISKMYNKEIFKSFTTARAAAERLFGKKSAQSQLIKTATNGVYGKTAQGITNKKVYIPLDDEMEELEPCSITQPILADTTTSIVRAILISAKIQIEKSGYKVYSITTDGMITNCPLDIVKSLDLFGLKTVLEKTLKYIKNEDSIWECKHEQKSFLNICTRGNIATNVNGVFAKNSFKMPEMFNNDSVESRRYLIDLIMSSDNTNQVEYLDKRFSTFKEIVLDKKDFIVEERIVTNTMTFDYKMKPRDLISKDVTVEYNNEVVEYKDTLYFETEYYKDIREFECYKSIATQFKRKSTDKSRGCIRTLEDAKMVNMKAFNSYNKTHFKSSGNYHKDIARNIVRALVNNKHDNVYEELKSVNTKCRKIVIDIINTVCCIDKKFTVEDFKNCIRTTDTVDYSFYQLYYEEVVKNIRNIMEQQK